MATKEKKTTKKKKTDKTAEDVPPPEPAADSEPVAEPTLVEPAAEAETTKKSKKKSSKEKKDAEEAPPPGAPTEEAVSEESAGAAEERTKSSEPKRAQRATSNVFALFNQAQIQEFKEAFAMIDQNRDGLIDVNDLRAIYTQIGREPDSRILEEMVAEAPGPINFTMFLGMFGDRLKGTDPESTLRDAFTMFDTEGKGKLNEEYIKDLLMNVGDQFSKEEIKQVWKDAPIEGGKLDYLKFVLIIKRGKENE
jgi:Ca2+-binding EF-hand superfamily protein